MCSIVKWTNSLHLYFLPSQEGTAYCYFAVFLKLATVFPWARSSLYLRYIFVLIADILYIYIYALYIYISCHRKKEQHAVILLFPSSWQQLLPWARSSLCLRYRYMCCRYSIHQNICPLHLYFLLSQERTTHCYFAVFLKLPTAAPRGEIKFMFRIFVSFILFV